MGDHRAEVKIEFTMHGHTRKFESYTSWWPGCSIPDSVRDWLEETRDELIDLEERRRWVEDLPRRQKAEEEKQRKEYERLKAKFEPKEPT